MVGHELRRQRQANVWVQEVAGVQCTRVQRFVLEFKDGRRAWWHPSLTTAEGGALVSSRST